jgi:hypothetical protein
MLEITVFLRTTGKKVTAVYRADTTLLSHRSRSGLPGTNTLSGAFTFFFLAMVAICCSVLCDLNRPLFVFSRSVLVVELFLHPVQSCSTLFHLVPLSTPQHSPSYFGAKMIFLSEEKLPKVHGYPEHR